MFITLTNSVPFFKGEKVIIRKDIILTVHVGPAVRGEGDTAVTEFVTYVFGGDKGTWEVQESIEEIAELLK